MISLLIILSMMSSCYDDKSTEASRSIDEIQIDTTGIGSILNVKFNQVLTVAPKISLAGEINSNNLSYEWQMTINSSSEKETTVISTESTLSKQIINLPSSKPYLLILTVTDNKTNLQKRILWNVYVNNSLGEGLIIATTNDGGQTSDLSWIHCKEIAEIYDGQDIVSSHLFTTSNNEKIPGRVNSLSQCSITKNDRTTENRIYVGSDQTMLTIDPSTYQISHKFQDLFYAAPATSQTSFISHISQGSFISVVNGDIYIFSKTGALDPHFGSPLTYGMKYRANKYLATEAMTSEVLTAAFSFYDETNGCICQKASGLAALFPIAPALSDGAYNPEALPGYEAMGAGLCDKGYHYHFLKEKSTNKYYFYTLKSNDTGIVSDAVYDLSNCSDISKSIKGIFNRMQTLMYYATSDKIYVAHLTSTPSATAVFDATSAIGSGDKITNIQLFQQAWYMNCNDDANQTPISNNNKMLIATTYNSSSKEGKVILLPINDLNTGTLGSAKIFTGFDEITCVGVQSK